MICLNTPIENSDELMLRVGVNMITHQENFAHYNGSKKRIFNIFDKDILLDVMVIDAVAQLLNVSVSTYFPFLPGKTTFDNFKSKNTQFNTRSGVKVHLFWTSTFPSTSKEFQINHIVPLLYSGVGYKNQEDYDASKNDNSGIGMNKEFIAPSKPGRPSFIKPPASTSQSNWQTQSNSSSSQRNNYEKFSSNREKEDMMSKFDSISVDIVSLETQVKSFTGRKGDRQYENIRAKLITNKGNLEKLNNMEFMMATIKMMDNNLQGTD